MCLIWKAITHILRKLKLPKIQQMIEGLPKDAGLRSAETSVWEWGPKVSEKRHDCLIYMRHTNTSSFCLFPWHLLQRPTKEKVIPCQWCVGWMQRASIHQVGQLQHYLSHLQLVCVLLFKATYLCMCCIHCIPQYSSISVHLLGTCREVAVLELDSWLLAVL